MTADLSFVSTLRRGIAIPAHPLALTTARRLDERRQRALSRYYIAAGVGGLAVGVHTTQFAIREPRIGLFEPVLHLAADEMNRADATRDEKLVRIGGICGKTTQAVAEAELLKRLGYHAGLLSLAALATASEAALVDHVRVVSERLPVIGFYLQPAVGGRALSYAFWRRLFETVGGVVAVKIAPFNRYQTLDVVRAVIDAGRDDVALYTGNDDNIVLDLLTPFRDMSCDSSASQTRGTSRRIVGGLLGHWSVWTQGAVKMQADLRRRALAGDQLPPEVLTLAAEVTDCNAAFFDAANGFKGCIAGLHAVLHRQGLLNNILCLDESEDLSPGQMQEIERVHRAYPHLNDDAFVRENLDAWLSN